MSDNVTLYPGTWDYFNNGLYHEKGNMDCPGCVENKPMLCGCGGLTHHHVRPDYGEPFENHWEFYCETCGKEREL